MLGGAIDEHTPIAFSIGALFSVGVALIGIVYRGLKLRDWWRDQWRVLNEKVNTMWAAQLRRGQLEGERTGVLLPERPHRINQEVWDGFVPIRDQIRLIYRRNPAQTDNDLALEIEKNYGEWIVENICRRFGIQEMACLLAAVIVAKQPGDNGQPDSRTAYRPVDYDRRHN
jgi:hypothetical protein